MSALDVQLFKPELMIPHCVAHHRDDLFDQLEQLLCRRGYVAPTWRAAIAAREECYPTGLDCSSIQIAIPHVDPTHVLKSYIAVLKLDHPVTFEGMGGMPPVDARLVVNLGLSGHDNEQVAALQALMEFMQDERAVMALMAQETSEGMLRALRTIART